MKINTITDIDLSKYRLAYYEGSSMSSYTMCQDDVMCFVEGGGQYDESLQIALIPKECRLTDCNGDDWNDVPAESNASGFYKYPKGTIFLVGNLGGELRLENENE